MRKVEYGKDLIGTVQNFEITTTRKRHLTSKSLHILLLGEAITHL